MQENIEENIFVIDKSKQDASHIKDIHSLYTENSKIIDIANYNLVNVFNQGKKYSNLIIEYNEDSHNKFVSFVSHLKRKYSIEITYVDEQLLLFLQNHIQQVFGLFLHLTNLYDLKTVSLWYEVLRLQKALSVKVESEVLLKVTSKIIGLAQLLNQNKDIHEFHLRDCDISNQVGNALLSGFLASKNLLDLRLTNCQFEPEMAEVLAKVLINNSCKVEILSLNNARITEESYEIILQALAYNQSIKQLEINVESSTELKLALLMLVESLKKNRGLKLQSLSMENVFYEEYELDEEEFETEGFDSLTSLLRLGSITHINIKGHRFTEAEIKQIADILADKPQFEHLEIDCNYQNWEFETRVVAYFAYRIKKHEIKISFNHPRYSKQLDELYEKTSFK